MIVHAADWNIYGSVPLPSSRRSNTMSKTEKHPRGARSKPWDNASTPSPDHSSVSEVEKGLETLSHLSSNPECLGMIIDGLPQCIKMAASVVDAPHGSHGNRLVTLTNQLLTQIVQTCHSELKQAQEHEREQHIFSVLSAVLLVAIDMISTNHSLTFIALTTINMIIDTSITHNDYRHYHCEEQPHNSTTQSSKAKSKISRKSSFKKDEKHKDSSSKKSRNLESVSEIYEGIPEEVDGASNGTPLSHLTQMEPNTFIKVLQDSIRLHKDEIGGGRIKCSPSTRWRKCTHHCNQILSARILVTMCHGVVVQKKIATSVNHLRILIDCLEPNNDPHLLVLILQCIVSLALEPSYHDNLISTDIADVLKQLLLPSDECLVWHFASPSLEHYRNYLQ